MDYDNLVLEQESQVAIVKINRPKALNSLNLAVIRELESAIYNLNNNDEIKTIILTGSGDKAFVAGADIAAMKDMEPGEAKDFAETGHRVFMMIERGDKPVIAAVNGYALGGGNELAMACDIRIAAEGAVFGQPEVTLGIIAGFGGTQRLAKIAGDGIARELLFTGEKIKARKAYKIGLVNKVVPGKDLMKEAKKVAKKIANNAPFAVKMTKEAINFGQEEGIEKGLIYESNAFSLCFSTEDQKEGMNAFLNREKPDFKGE